MLLRITVNQAKCEKHGQCVIAAPHLFSWDSGGELAWLSEAPESQREGAVDAADVCPVQAIAIGD